MSSLVDYGLETHAKIIDNHILQYTNTTTRASPAPICIYIRPPPPTSKTQSTNLKPFDRIQVPNQDVAVDKAEVREEGTERGRDEVALGDGGEAAEPVLCLDVGLFGLALGMVFESTGGVAGGGRPNRFEHTLSTHTTHGPIPLSLLDPSSALPIWPLCARTGAPIH